MVLSDVAWLINSSLDLNEVLRLTLESSTGVMRAEAGSVILLDPESDELVIEVATGPKGKVAQSKRFPKGEGIAGLVFETGIPKIVSDVDKDATFFKGVDELTGFKTRSMLAVPLRVKGEIIGVLEVLNKKDGGLFGDKDLELFTTLSDLAAISINNAQIYAELKQAESLVIDSEERLNRLIEHLPVGVCLLDDKWHLLLANPAARQVLPGLTEAAEGEPISQLGEVPIQELAKDTPEKSPTRVVVEGPPNRIFEVELNPIKRGRSGGKRVLLIRDVTEQDEDRVRAQLQDRLATVGKLAVGIAHDFNNMLTVMTGSAEVLGMREDISEDAKENLKRIIFQGQRAEQLIRQILDFSRQTGVQRQPVDLVSFLKEDVKLLERTLPENIRLSTGFEDGEYVVHANLTQLQEVIANLAVNARDAMPTGGEMRVGLSRISIDPDERRSIRSSSSPIVPEIEPGEWIVWTVSDTGEGIAPDVMEKIFEPFFTTKEAIGGTGLGLSQVYGIVKQHGGYIDAHSEVGKGTDFSVFLKPVKEEAAPVERADTGIPGGGGETILVVEDQEHVLEVTRDMLERLNYRVITASDGREALEVFDRNADEVALVLTDVVMPKMGGVELVAALKGRDQEVPIVMMTGYQASAPEALLPSGEITAFMEKPLRLHNVAQVLRKALEEDGGS